MNSYPLGKSLEVLQLLVQYGTCSVQTLEWMLGKDRRRIHEQVNILSKRHLVRKLSTSVSGCPAVHVQVSSSPTARRIIADLLGLNINDLPKRGFPITQLVHEDACAKLHFKLNMEFKDVIVVRDWQMTNTHVPEEVLPKKLQRERLIPDLLIGIPAEDKQGAWRQNCVRWVAIELDRTRKNLNRLREKLHIYARETQVDGLLYILPEWLLIENLGKYFESSVVPKAVRIRSFSKSFLARTYLGEQDKELSNIRLLCGNQVINLRRWIDFLGSTHLHNRAEEWNKLTGSCPGDLKIESEFINL